MEQRGLWHRQPNIQKDHTNFDNETMGISLQTRRNSVVNGATRRNFISCFLIISVVLALIVLKTCSHFSSTPPRTHGEERTWHGGHPASDKPGSCWCGGDGYCMCTPSVAIDIVLYSEGKSGEGADYDVWLVRRSDTSQLATIGGFVEMGESTEEAVIREVEEETGILINRQQHLSNNNHNNKLAMKLLGVYSDPRRDNRRDIVSIAYALQFIPGVMKTKDGSNIPKAGSDAKEVVSIPLSEIGTTYINDDLYADHLSILLDFKERILEAESNNRGERAVDPVRRGGVVRNGELYDDISRSTCFSLL